jgi:hypothetical protein
MRAVVDSRELAASTASQSRPHLVAMSGRWLHAAGGIAGVLVAPILTLDQTSSPCS